MSKEEKIDLFTRLMEDEMPASDEVEAEPELERALEETGEFYRNEILGGSEMAFRAPLRRRLRARAGLMATAALAVVLLASAGIGMGVISKALNTVRLSISPTRVEKVERPKETTTKKAASLKPALPKIEEKPVPPKPATEATPSPSGFEANPAYAPIIAAIREDKSGMIPARHLNAVVAHISRVLVYGDWARLDWSRFGLGDDHFDGAAAILRKNEAGGWQLVAVGTNLLRSSYPESPDDLWATTARVVTSVPDDPDRIAITATLKESNLIASEMKADGFLVDYMGIKGDWAFARIHAKKYRLGAGVIAKRVDGVWQVYYIGNEGLTPADHLEVPPEIFK